MRFKYEMVMPHFHPTFVRCIVSQHCGSNIYSFGYLFEFACTEFVIIIIVDVVILSPNQNVNRNYSLLVDKVNCYPFELYSLFGLTVQLLA